LPAARAALTSCRWPWVEPGLVEQIHRGHQCLRGVAHLVAHHGNELGLLALAATGRLLRAAQPETGEQQCGQDHPHRQQFPAEMPREHRKRRPAEIRGLGPALHQHGVFLRADGAHGLVDLLQQRPVLVAHDQVQAARQGAGAAMQQQAVAMVAADQRAHHHVEPHGHVHHAGFHGRKRLAQGRQRHHLQVRVVGGHPFIVAAAANHGHPPQVGQVRRVGHGVAAGQQGLPPVVGGRGRQRDAGGILERAQQQHQVSASIAQILQCGLGGFHLLLAELQAGLLRDQCRVAADEVGIARGAVFGGQ
jgi:hypothetical protein